MPDGFDDASSRERMLVALARIEERQIAIQDAAKAAQVSAEARHTNLMNTMATFVPRSEVEKDVKAVNFRIDELEERLRTVEKRIWGAVAAILSSVLAAIAGVFGIVVKHG